MFLIIVTDYQTPSESFCDKIKFVEIGPCYGDEFHEFEPATVLTEIQCEKKCFKNAQCHGYRFNDEINAVQNCILFKEGVFLTFKHAGIFKTRLKFCQGYVLLRINL